jgi:sugar diacid utilization regulator
MRLHRTLALTIFLLAAEPGTGSAQVPDDGKVDVFSTLEAWRYEEAAARETIRSVLGRQEVRAVADDLGIDLEEARGAVDLLEGDDLERARQRANSVEDALDQERTTISFRTTTLIILLLLTIIIILLV